MMKSKKPKLPKSRPLESLDEIMPAKSEINGIVYIDAREEFKAYPDAHERALKAAREAHKQAYKRGDRQARRPAKS